MKIDVSVVCFVYNHEKFLSKALDGFLMQKFKGNYEVIIHDDASNDFSASIIRDYSKKFPKIIKPIYQDVNQASQERGRVTRICFEQAQGKYIAMCEGDDFWTDKYKLQKQFEELESNSELSICFHYVNVLNDKDSIIAAFKPIVNDNLIVFKDVFNGKKNETRTSSIFFNKSKLDFKLINNQAYAGDYFLKLALLSKGQGYRIPEVMSTYRVHDGGSWSFHKGLENVKRRISDQKLKSKLYKKNVFKNRVLLKLYASYFKLIVFKYGRNIFRLNFLLIKV